MHSFTNIIWCFHFACGIGIFELDNGYRMLIKRFEPTKELNSVNSNKTDSKVLAKWILQPIDHFNKSDNRRWMMRYFERIDMWRPGGPIFLFIGGEGEARPSFLKRGMVYELANETNGALFMSEHRYYGKSMPLNNSGTNNLKYLSSRQALADLSRLLKIIKFNAFFKKSKVVLVGGSYPGNLAAWMKVLYPHQVDAAVASSAPVLAKQDFYEYLETVTDVYEESGNKKCYDKIVKTFQRYRELMTTKEGIAILKLENNVCESSDLSKPENQHLFTYAKAGYFMVNVQYGSEEKVLSHCNTILNSDSKNNPAINETWFGSDISEHSFWNSKKECYEVDFDAIVDEIKQGGQWLSSWVYQKCTEFSYAKTTSSDKQIFSKNIPLTTFYKLCVDSFGEDYGEDNVAKSVNRTNEMYGGIKPKVKQVIFVNGEMDPWHRLGILEDLSYEAPAKLVPRSSHCRDLSPQKKSDPEELVETRKYVKYIIKQWIGIEAIDKKA